MEVKTIKKNYTKEFKIEAVKLVLDQKLKVTEAAKQLGVAHSSLSRWISDFNVHGSHCFPGKGNLLPWDQEKRELEKRVKKAEMANEILKKAFQRKNFLIKFIKVIFIRHLKYFFIGRFWHVLVLNIF